jgi:membrane protein YqaA with SNARE-associated domain
MLTYLVVFGIVLGVNLMPAFGPPTWTILVLYRFQSDLNPVALVIVGAIAAASGRLALGYGARAVRSKLSKERQKSLDAMRERLERHRRAGLLGLFLFALSPLPSAQLFEAAGVTGVKLPPITAAFFVGRIISYSIYMAGASALKGTDVGEMIRKSFTSPVGIALQLVFLALVVVLGRVDWSKRFGGGDDQDGKSPERPVASTA